MSVRFSRAPKVRGISVPHRKTASGSVTSRPSPPARVILPLRQHIGAPSVPVVEKGDLVFVGSLIAKAGGFVGADIHASVSGTVVGFPEMIGSDGSPLTAIEIESDGKMTPDPACKPPVVTDAETLVAAVKASGLVGLGGAGFPTHVKLSIPKDKPAPDTLILNGAECEPYISSDERAMIEDTSDLFAGIRTVLRALKIPKAIIGVEKSNPDAVRALQEREEPDIEVRVLNDTYPQGAEKVLIANVTGREIPIGGLPIDAGVVVMNVTSAAFLGKYLRTGMPLTEKRITVAGGAIERPGNYIFPIGTSISYILETCGYREESCRKILMGGPMMGIALWTANTPLLKNNNAILALTQKEISGYPDQPCIHCGRCVCSCPMGLSPVEIVLEYECGEIDRAAKLSAMNCIECGSCSYVCPAGRPLTQYLRLTKAEIRKAGAKK